MELGSEAVWFGVAFPVLVGIGVALAVSDSNEIEFWVARGCFIVAALDALYFVVIWLWRSDDLRVQTLIVGALITGAAVVALVYGLKWVDYREEKSITKLQPGSKSRPQLPPDCDPPDDAMVVLFGSNVAWGSLPYTVLQMGSTSMLAVDKVLGKSQININVLRIFDDRGNIMARIDEDGFWVAPDVRRQKPNRSTLVVYDRADQQAVKVEFLNSKTLYVEGIFRDRRGAVVQITPSQLILPGNNTMSHGCFGGGNIAFHVN
jgi:hypothetical protein